MMPLWFIFAMVMLVAGVAGGVVVGHLWYKHDHPDDNA